MSNIAVTQRHAEVDRVAQRIEQQRLAYKVAASSLTDCSGIFLRAADEISSRCPELRVPTVEQARSSALIAAWFAERGQYIALNGPTAIDSAIDVGDVAFFSDKSSNGKALSYSQIDHMGVIVAINRDANGRVVSYSMLHGRKPGTRAAVTHYHARHTANDRPLGNGKQWLIGVAKMCGKARCVCGDSEFAGVGHSKTVVVPTGPKRVQDYGLPDTVEYDGKSYRVAEVLVGKASWYGEWFHGRLTANGERYNMNAMTAAHKSLPFNTVVRVIRRDNGKSVVVRINDRGPYIEGRIIDLSREAGRRMGLMDDGVTDVYVEILAVSE